MIEYFYKGGLFFMGLLTLTFFSVIFMIASTALELSFRKIKKLKETHRKINQIKAAGLFALIVGLLGQLIGLFSAYKAIRIEQVEASPSLLYVGFTVSAITTVYGLLIFTFTLSAAFLLSRIHSRCKM